MRRRAGAVAVCLLVITGCGAGNPASAPAPGAPSFVYVAGEIANPIYRAIWCGAKTVAADAGASVDIQEVEEFTAAGQIPVLNAAVARQPAGILISPTSPTGLAEPLRVVTEDKKLPVVTVLNSLDDTSIANAQVLVDNEAAGRLAADHLATRAGGAPFEVALITFTAGASRVTDAEDRGFLDQLTKHANLELVATERVTDQPSDATRAMNAVLSRHPELDGVFTTFGFAAQGILASVRQRGASPVVVAGYGAGTAELVDALRAGELAAIVDFPLVEVGAEAMSQLLNAANGRPTRPSTELPPVLYTQASFDDPTQAANLGSVQCPV